MTNKLNSAQRVPVEKILSNGNLELTQLRHKVNSAVVKEYANLLKEDANALPPIELTKDDNGTLWVTDGFHRLHAHVSCGIPEVMAFVESGSVADAIERAIPSNSKHGLPRTPADIDKVVKMILKPPTMSELKGLKKRFPNSDRAIAELIGVSQPTVSKARKRLEEAGTVKKREKVTGKDGVERDITSNKVEGGKRKGAIVEHEEPAPLRIEAGPGKTAPQALTPTVDGLGEAVPESLHGVFAIAERMEIEFSAIARSFERLDEYTAELVEKADPTAFEQWQGTIANILQMVLDLKRGYQPYAVIQDEGGTDWASKMAYEMEADEEPG